MVLSSVSEKSHDEKLETVNDMINNLRTKISTKKVTLR